MTTTLYCRSDTQTVNTVTGYILGDTNSNSNTFFGSADGGVAAGCMAATATYSIATISALHSNGSETTIGTNVAITTRVTTNAEGIQSATFNCPLTTLLPTDALKVVLRANVYVSVGHYTDQTFITTQLGWGKLNASTWTIYRYSKITYSCVPYNPPYAHLTTASGSIYHGDSTYTTYIDGIDYTLGGGNNALLVAGD